MNRGDKIYFVRGKRRMLGELIATYDFPAIRIKVQGAEKIVGAEEVESWDSAQAGREKAKEDRRLKRKSEKLEGLKRENKWILDLWKDGMTTREWIQVAGGWSIGDWQRILRMKRAGIIK